MSGPEEAKALLKDAVVAVKKDKEKALEIFSKGESGFRDRVYMCSAPTLQMAL